MTPGACPQPAGAPGWLRAFGRSLLAEAVSRVSVPGTVTGAREGIRQAGRPPVTVGTADQSLLPPNIFIGLGIIFMGFMPLPPRSSSGP